MPGFTRPDDEIQYEVHGSGFPLPPLGPGGPTHLAESIRRVTDFLTRIRPGS